MALTIRKILVPTDFSATSEKAIRYAVELAQVFHSELTLLHILDTRIVDNIYRIHQLTPEQARIEMQRSAKERLDELMKSDWCRGVNARPHFAEGLPPVVVKTIAEEIGADLIVMGTHGSGGITHLLYGSTTEGVVRGAPCPVLTVNP